MLRRITGRAGAATASSARPRANISFFAAAKEQQALSAKDLSEKLFGQVKGLHEATLAPLNEKWLGPLEKTGGELIPLPLVLVLGNHSSGKSTFINHLLGRKIQESGVAPTDDGFTILARGVKDIDQDGPALVGDKDLGFGGLRQFGTNFINHLKLKLRTDLRIDGIAVIDSPGFIDSPVAAAGGGAGQSVATDYNALGARVIAGGDSSSQGQGGGILNKAAAGMNSDRGFDFPGAIRWYAQRADLILLFFDPEKPGTTGETLNILTTSLVGEENKLIFVLNKADTFRKTHDFARAYGALSWNLSKVIPRKDLPRIATMRVPVDGQPGATGATSAANNAGFLKDTLPDLDATLQEVSARYA
jgi:GTPase SAR1 family protein